MNTLIIFASKYGCTEKCAKKLSQRLTGNVDVVNINKAKEPDLRKYDKVIIGGSIYMGKIQRSIKRFCSKNAKLLSQKEVGLYICCMFVGDKAQESLKKVYSQELYSKAIVKDYFGGEMNFNSMNFFDKQMTKMIATAGKTDESMPKIDLENGTSILSFEKIAQFADSMNGIKKN